MPQVPFASPSPTRPVVVLVAAMLVVALAAAGCTATTAESARPSATAPGGVEVAGSVPPPPVVFPRDLVPYAGLGAWIDVFDYAPAYQRDGAGPALSVDDLDDMRRRGVSTLFLQATRWDDKSPEGIVDAELVGGLLLRAHRLGMRVVGWYLPRLVDVELDLARARQIHEFRVAGERFDGLAIDIEYTEGEPDVAVRNANLVRFSTELRAQVADTPIAGVVPAAVHLEVVNDKFWPDFPYRDLRALYDIWMPMVYWTLRTPPYADGYRFARESVDRLRANLEQPAALVAPIGGISDEMTLDSIAEFGQALVDTGATGGSFYDWNTMAPEKQAEVHRIFTRGPAASLPGVPPWSPPPAPPTTTSTTTSTVPPPSEPPPSEPPPTEPPPTEPPPTEPAPSSAPA